MIDKKVAQVDGRTTELPAPHPDRLSDRDQHALLIILGMNGLTPNLSMGILRHFSEPGFRATLEAAIESIGSAVEKADTMVAHASEHSLL